jgi:hypothetical protein
VLLVFAANPMLFPNKVGHMTPAKGAFVAVMKGDFPPYFSIDPYPMPWQIYPGIGKTSEVYFFEMITGENGPIQDQELGHIAIVHYAYPAWTKLAYDAIREEAEWDRVPQPLNIGERGSLTGPGSTWDSSDVLFQRCNTVAHITFQGQKLDLLRSYAERLHERIVKAYC